MTDKDDRGRSPILKTAAYSPLVAGSIYAASKFQGMEFTKPSPYESVIGSSTALARNAMDHAGPYTPNPDEALKVLESFTKEGYVGNIQKNSNIAIRAFGAAMTDANSGLEREMMDKALAKAMQLVSEGSPKTGRFMAESILKTGSPVVGEIFKRVYGSGLQSKKAMKSESAKDYLRRSTVGLLKISDEPTGPFNVYAMEDLSMSRQAFNLSIYNFKQSAEGHYSLFPTIEEGNRFNPLNKLREAGLEFRPVAEIVGQGGGPDAARYLQIQLYRGEKAQDVLFNLPLRYRDTKKFSQATKETLLLGEKLTPYRTTNLISNGGILSGHQFQQALFSNAFGQLSKEVYKGKTPDPLSALRAYNNFLETIASAGRYSTPPVTSGGLLRGQLQSNLIYPEENLVSPHPATREQVISNYEKLKKDLGRAPELLSSGSLTKGAFMDPDMKLGTNNIDLSNVIENRASFKDTDRLFQNTRDTAFSPTNWVARAFGLRQSSNGIGMAAPRRTALENAMSFDRFRGVAHTPAAEKFFTQQGYIGPHATILHVADEKMIEKLHYKFNINEGEGLVTAAMNPQTGMAYRQETVVTQVFAGLQKKGLIRSQSMANLTRQEQKILKKELRKTFTSEAFGNLIRVDAPSQIKVRGALGGQVLGNPALKELYEGASGPLSKPLRLERGMELGLSPEGGLVKALDMPGVVQQVMHKEFNPRTNIWTYHMKNTLDFETLAKTYGLFGRLNLQGTDSTVMQEALSLAFKNNTTLINELGLNKPGAVNIITPGSGAIKTLAGQEEQMVSGLMDVLMRRKRGSGRTIEQEQLLKMMTDPKTYGMKGLRKYVSDVLGFSKTAQSKHIGGMVSLAASHLVDLTASEASMVFGIWAHGNKARTKWLKKEYGKEAFTGFGLGYHGLYVEEMGRDLHGTPQGSVERRHIESLLGSMQDPMTKRVDELLFEETISATATPRKRARVDELTKLHDTIAGRLSKSEIAKIAPESEWVDYNKWGALSKYWPEKSFVAKLSKEQATALGTPAIYIPGRSSITRSRAGHLQSSGEYVQESILTKLGARINDMMISTGPKGRLSPHEVQNALARTKEAAIDEIVTYTNEMFEGKLGPSSAYMYGRSVSLADDKVQLASNLANRQITTRAGVVHGYGDRWAFFSKVKAEEMLNESTKEMIDAGQTPWYEAKVAEDHAERLAKMQGRGGMSAAQLQEMTYRQAYLGGHSPHPSMLIRQPENRPTSFMLGYSGVHSGPEDLIIIGEKFDQVSKGLEIPNFKKIRISTGFAGFSGGDFDGDHFNVKLLMHQKTPGEFMNPELPHLQDYVTKKLENRLQTEIVRKQLAEGFKNIAMETLDEMDPKHAEIISLFMTKGEVPKISLRITELNTAMRHFSGDPKMNLMAQTVLSELEETLILKGRKVKYPIPLANRVAQALAPGTAERADFGEFRGILEELLDQGGYAGLDNPVQLGDQTIQLSLANANELTKSMETAWTSYQGSIQEAYTQAIRMGMKSKNLSDFTTRRELVDFIGKGGTAEQYFASLITGGSGRSSARKLLDEFSWTKGLMKSIERAKFPKGAAVPLMAGLAASAVALTMFGGPGYGPEPIIPKGVKIDPSVAKSIQDGTLFMASQKPADARITPDTIRPQYSGGGPQANPMLMPPTARIASRNSTMRVSSQGDHMNTQLERFLGGLDSRFNRANINARIRDDRRPLVPSQNYY